MNNAIVQNRTATVKSHAEANTPLTAARRWAAEHPRLEARIVVHRARWDGRRTKVLTTEYYAHRGQVEPDRGVGINPRSSIFARNGLCHVCGAVYTQPWIRAAFTPAGEYVGACPICIAVHDLELRNAGDAGALPARHLNRYEQPAYTVEINLADGRINQYPRGCAPAHL